MNREARNFARLAALSATVALGASALIALDAHAVECVRGVYRAGCVGPDGAVAVAKPPVVVAHPPGTIKCADGIYRAACTGPNGTAVVRKRY